MALLAYDITYFKNKMFMKKISLLLVGLLALFSCEQEEFDNLVKSDAGQAQTRATSSIADFDPIAELSKIPVNIINVGNGTYKYLSADAKSDAICLAKADDGSLLQRWYINLGLTLVGGHTPVSNNWAMLPKIGKDYPILENCSSFYDLYATPHFNIKGDDTYEIFQQRNPMAGICGGYLQAKDKKNKTLVYKSSGSSDIALWQVAPVGEYNIVKMEYESSVAYNDYIEQQNIYVTGAVFGDLPNDVQHVFNVGKTISSKSSFSRAEGTTIQSQSSSGFSLGIGDASKVHIGFDGKISNTITSSETLTWGEETSETLSVSQSFTMTIPPHTPCRIEVLWRTYKASITYVATLEKADGIAKGERFRIKGKWRGVTTSDIYYNMYSTIDNKLMKTERIPSEGK